MSRGLPYLNDGQPIDLRLLDEFQAANIPVIRLPAPVEAVGGRYSLEGRLGHFEFRRQIPRYYWMVSGLMPLDLAEELYAQPDGRAARPGGHCAAPPPADQAKWIEPCGREGCADWKEQRNEAEKMFPHAPVHRAELLARMDRGACARTPAARPFLFSWHVDTLDALRLLGQYIRRVTIEISELDGLYRARKL